MVSASTVAAARGWKTCPRQCLIFQEEIQTWWGGQTWSGMSDRGLGKFFGVFDKTNVAGRVLKKMCATPSSNWEAQKKIKGGGRKAWGQNQKTAFFTPGSKEPVSHRIQKKVAPCAGRGPCEQKGSLADRFRLKELVEYIPNFGGRRKKVSKEKIYRGGEGTRGETPK